MRENAQQRQMINSLKRELGENDAELDDDSDDPLLRRIRRECEKRVRDYEERLKRSQVEGELQDQLLDKAKKDLAEARSEADDAHRGAISIFNEQKRYESHIQRLQSEVHRANSAVETSNNAARDAQALLRMNQDQQQQRMPPPTSLPTLTGGNISNTPFVQPFSTPSTALRTGELHGPGYYHVGSPADPGYAEHMRAMFGRDEVDPPRRDSPTLGSSSQGTSSQSTQRTAWQARPGQGIPAFPGSRIIPARAIDSRDTAYRRTLHFGTTKVPKLTRAT
jgi:hypothetical protein